MPQQAHPGASRRSQATAPGSMAAAVLSTEDRRTMAQHPLDGTSTPPYLTDSPPGASPARRLALRPIAPAVPLRV